MPHSVTLRPFGREDVARLWRLAARDPGAPWDSLGACRAAVDRAREMERTRREFHFAIETRPAGRLAGITSLFDVDWSTLSASAGTWIARSYRGRGLNERAKALLLDRAFWDLGLTRVRFETPARNVRSRRALEKLGAVEDGFVPAALSRETGATGDLVLFSIWRDEDQ